jgi:hypothetical protein
MSFVEELTDAQVVNSLPPLWVLKTHGRIHKILILNMFNLVSNSTPYFCKIPFNIITLSMHSSTKRFFP